MNRSPYRNGTRLTLPVAVRYALFQIPSAVIILAALALLRLWLNIPLWVVWMLMALWIAKDIALFPFLWRSYVPGKSAGMDTMVGRMGTATERLAPVGRVLVRGELWRARLVENAPPVEAGETVRVVDIQGLAIVVEPTVNPG